MQMIVDEGRSELHVVRHMQWTYSTRGIGVMQELENTI